MIKKVRWSDRSVFVTVIATGILVAGMIYGSENTTVFTSLSVLMAAILLSMWYYSPVSIEVNGEAIIVRKRISRKTIPFSSIESVSSFVPMPWLINQRVCGSGGYAGYWGWFKEPENGTYFGYYGESNNCFLVKLKNGRKYVLGCEDSQSVIDFITEKISK